MNEQMVTWFEGLIPEIKETGDPRGVMTKFAKDNNLAPSLLEKMGQLYNTAKTQTYLDKSAREGMARGETFKVMDVQGMVSDYEKSATEVKAYTDKGFRSLKQTSAFDLFGGPWSTDMHIEPAYDYQEAKAASQFMGKFDTLDTINQGISDVEQMQLDLQEDTRELLNDISHSIKNSNTDVTFASIEDNAVAYFGDGIKAACDLLHHHAGDTLARGTGLGRRKLASITPDVQKLAQVQVNLNELDKIDSFLKEAHSTGTKNNTGTNTGRSGSYQGQGMGRSNPVRSSEPSVFTQLKDKTDSEHLKDVFGTMEMADKGLGAGIRNISALGGAITDKMLDLPDYIENKIRKNPTAERKNQKKMDLDYANEQAAAMIQDLLITDPILSEEDPDNILDFYETIRSVAPTVANDKNVMRVSLRAAAQHDGIAPQDLKYFIDLEHDMQKVRSNQRIESNDMYVFGNRDQTKEKSQLKYV
jgi:hypothetical protein